MKKDFDTTGTQLYSNFIHKSRYARWLDDKGRRETWDETVDRYISFFCARFPKQAKEIKELRSAIFDLRVLPSMRCLMSAGRALERDEVAGFNCSYVSVDHPRAFDEILYVLMCGTGVGFSVERQYISKLPEVAEEMYPSDTSLVVEDSKIGWATSFRELVSLLYSGKIPKWDLSKLRPAGAKLKTFGGRSSGPEPLNDLFKFTVALFKKATGRKLSSLEAHDLICKIAEAIVVGGVRRSALISLSNLSDDRMRLSKSGQWWIDNPQRSIANNSAVYTERPDFEIFLNEWVSLYQSKSGERGIFSRVAAQKQATKNGRRDANFEFGTNPCSEIILRPNQFCNLSTVVVRGTDTMEDLKEKVRCATILGTLQSSLTNFRYLRKIWKKNTEEEALLGVSMTGIMDNHLLNDPNDNELPQRLNELKKIAVETNEIWAKKIGVNQSVAITCVKPEGTVSQLTNTASGIHPRFSKHYIRRVRADVNDPLAEFMRIMGFPCEPDVMRNSNLVFDFPIAAPEKSVLVKDVGAIEQLKLWEIYQDNWCEHKPSITVYYKDTEFLEVGSWVWNKFDKISGVSFLPVSDHIYAQAPYEEISQEKYDELVAKQPKEIDWIELSNFEKEDNTEGMQTLSCVGGYCEVVDLTKDKSTPELGGKT